jgi:hypothetical protein
MDRKTALEKVAFILDTAGYGRPCRMGLGGHSEILDSAVLVGWKIGLDCIFVAVADYLGGAPDVDHARELARDYRQEIDGLGECPPADYVVLPGE